MDILTNGSVLQKRRNPICQSFLKPETPLFETRATLSSRLKSRQLKKTLKC